MPMEIEMTRWTATKPLVRAPSAALGAVATSPEKTVGGYRARVNIESNQTLSAADLGLLLVPPLQGLKLEFVEPPKLVVEDSPIWVWQAIKDAKGQVGYQAVLMAGALKGYQGTVMSPSDCVEVVDEKTGESLSWKCKLGVPTTKDTAVLPRCIMAWSALVRPASLESSASAIRKALKTAIVPLMSIAVSPIEVLAEAIQVPAPKSKMGGVGLILVGALGVTLAALKWGKK